MLNTELLTEILDLSALPDRIAAIRTRLAGRIAFTTSLGLEDQVITDAIARSGAAIDIVTLETGRLFPETLQLLDETQRHYGLDIKQFGPADTDIAAYKKKYGLNGFYESIEARKACCHFRKVVPLGWALDGASGWITGIRQSQSDNRQSMKFAEHDADRNLLKLNPLIDWSAEQVESYIAAHGVPVNTLHARGYPSIGCEPCTRAIKPGEHERAGRWWWENENTQECGLHVAAAENG